MQNIHNNNYRSHKKRIIIVSLIIITLVIASMYGYFMITKNDNPIKDNVTGDTNKSDLNVINLDGPTSEQIQAGNDAKQATVDSTTATPSATFNATITAANQNSNILQVRAIIDTVSSDGTCDITLSQGEKTVVKTANIQALASTSTCEGFDIPTSELSTGEWTLLLKVTIGSQTSTDTRIMTIS